MLYTHSNISRNLKKKLGSNIRRTRQGTFAKSKSKEKKEQNEQSSEGNDFKKLWEETKKAYSESNHKEVLHEWGAFLTGAVGLAVATDVYQRNREELTDEKVMKKLEDGICYTIPSSFENISPKDARIQISKALDNAMISQNAVSHVRTLASQLSPAFTLVPVLATPAFAVTSSLSLGDVVNIAQMMRIKKMVEMHPEILPSDKKEKYDKLMHNVETHFLKEIKFDLLKISYRGQIIAVNQKLKENEKPQKVYSDPFFKFASSQRLIPQKNNIPVVSWILPTSYLISNLAAQDTRELNKDLKKLDDFFKQNAFSDESFESPKDNDVKNWKPLTQEDLDKMLNESKANPNLQDKGKKSSTENDACKK